MLRQVESVIQALDRALRLRRRSQQPDIQDHNDVLILYHHIMSPSIKISGQTMRFLYAFGLLFFMMNFFENPYFQ
jgi:hypothetical protein